MPWFRHCPPGGYLESIEDRCASEGCENEPSWRLEAGGIASFYCSECRIKIDEQELSELNELRKLQRGETVPMPVNRQHAIAMHLVAERWLKDNPNAK